MRNGFFVFAVPAIVLFASACAPAATGGAANSPSGAVVAQQVTIEASDILRFDPATVTVKTGQPLQVTLQNSGQILHDFIVEDGLPKPVVISEEAVPPAHAGR